MTSGPRIGAVLQTPGAQLASTARRFEDAGADTLWTGDYFQSGLVRAAVLGAATSRVRVGTHVLQAFARSPLATALAARELHDLTGGRFVLGLGSQLPAANRRWHGVQIERPVRALREYVAAVRGLLDSGGVAEFDGEHFSYRVPGFGAPATMPPPPVWIGGAGPATVRLAAGAADGLAGHLLWTYDHIREQVAPVAGAVPITVARFVAVDTVPSHRLDLARRIAHYAVTPAYANVLAAVGVAVDRDAVLAALCAHDDAVLDREIGPHLRHWCITSAQQLDEHRAAAASAGVDELVLLVPFDAHEPDRVRTYEAELARLITGVQQR